MQRHLVKIADRTGSDDALNASTWTLEQFLSSLRTAWKEREVRPTARPKTKITRATRHVDPLETTTAQLRAWSEAELFRTGRELLEQLRATHPGIYPDGQLRTLQRRLKIWRSEMAQEMVFGPVKLRAYAESDAATGAGYDAAGALRCSNGCIELRQRQAPREQFWMRQHEPAIRAVALQASLSSPVAPDRP